MKAGLSRSLPLVTFHQVHPGEDAAAEGLQEISLDLVGWQGKRGVQGVETENRRYVATRSSSR